MIQVVVQARSRLLREGCLLLPGMSAVDVDWGVICLEHNAFRYTDIDAFMTKSDQCS